ncbi:hypothetical protein RAB80_017954 [Fusarium oxysporum f. sp. vasinfectum]|nr:hypothetical protein RAB80_017954 [Fusarium oxysporum f. sp. vasinfectum]
MTTLPEPQPMTTTGPGGSVKVADTSDRKSGGSHKTFRPSSPPAVIHDLS